MLLLLSSHHLLGSSYRTTPCVIGKEAELSVYPHIINEMHDILEWWPTASTAGRLTAFRQENCTRTEWSHILLIVGLDLIHAVYFLSIGN